MRFKKHILQIGAVAALLFPTHGQAIPKSLWTHPCVWNLTGFFTSAEREWAKSQQLQKLEKLEPWKYRLPLLKEILIRTRDPEALIRFSKRFSSVYFDQSRYFFTRAQERLSFEIKTLDITAAKEELSKVYGLEAEGFRLLRANWEILKKSGWRIQLQNNPLLTGHETPFSKNQYTLERKKKLISVKLGPDTVPWIVALAEAIFILSTETKLNDQQLKTYLEFQEGTSSVPGRLFYHLVMSSAGDLTAYFYLSLTKKFYFQGCNQWEELTLQDDLISLRRIIRTHVIFYLFGKGLIHEDEFHTLDNLSLTSLWDKQELTPLWEHVISSSDP